MEENEKEASNDMQQEHNEDLSEKKAVTKIPIASFEKIPRKEIKRPLQKIQRPKKVERTPSPQQESSHHSQTESPQKSPAKHHSRKPISKKYRLPHLRYCPQVIV
jgi:hypothetical protein